MTQDDQLRRFVVTEFRCRLDGAERISGVFFLGVGKTLFNVPNVEVPGLLLTEYVEFPDRFIRLEGFDPQAGKARGDVVRKGLFQGFH